MVSVLMTPSCFTLVSYYFTFSVPEKLGKILSKLDVSSRLGSSLSSKFSLVRIFGETERVSSGTAAAASKERVRARASERERKESPRERKEGRGNFESS